MKSLIALMQYVLHDCGTRCGTSTTRDLKTITSRYEHEGASFLTISLSKFGKDFTKSLDQGFVAHDQFAGFRRFGGLPRFLGGFLELVFDRESGRLLDVPSIDAIFSIRQITLFFEKIKIPCTPARELSALNRYIECEQDVRLSDSALLSAETDRLECFSRVGRLLWADFFSRVDSRIYNDGVLPRHGPGATADKLRGNAKYYQTTWPLRLENVFPHWENMIPSESFLQRTDGVCILEPGNEIPVKVITVPKTLKTPRIIAVEPTAMQYMQQGILAVMMEEMPRFDQTRRLVMFEEQEPNQRLALEGSVSGALATLDLSEASDRVSNQHVRLLVKNHRALRHAVDSTRSRKADILGKTVRLSKFASMGSALCFPFEAMVFATVIFVGIEQQLNRRLTKKDISSFFGRVRVYGDDIIVPVEFVQSVTAELEAFGFKVNSDKSFWTGKFRESCGKDYYDGVDITISRCRRTLPLSRADAEEVSSAVSLRNQLFHAGFDTAVNFLDNAIRKTIAFPVVNWSHDQSGKVVQRSPLLGRHDYTPCQGERHDEHLHRPLVKGSVMLSQSPVSILDDCGALLKFFLKKGFDPLSEGHLQRSGRSSSVRIKTRWACPL